MRHPAFVIVAVLAFGVISGSRSPVLVAASEPTPRPATESTLLATVLDDVGGLRPPTVSRSPVAAALTSAGSHAATLSPPAAPVPTRPALTTTGPLAVEPFAQWTSPATAPPPARVASAIGAGVATFDAPGSTDSRHWFSNPTQFGGPRVFLVIDEVPGYVQVLLPVRPNGRTGWVPSEQVTVAEVTTRAEVDLAGRMLRVWDGADLTVETPVVIGAGQSPTPEGTFFVRDVIDKADPGGAYGPHILALSGFSEVLDSFQGGEPAIAIHGTNRPELLGQARSNGCVRIPNGIVAQLAAAVPLGTPVTIVA